MAENTATSVAPTPGTSGVVSEYDALVAEFPKPLTSFQRADINTSLANLERGEGKVRNALNIETAHAKRINDFIATVRDEIAVLKGEKPAPPPTAVASTTGVGAPLDGPVGEKRKRGADDDGKDARAAEQASTAAPATDASGEPSAAASSPAAAAAGVAVAASAPTPARPRAVLGKDSKIFASLQGFLKGTQKQNDKLNDLTKQRNEIAVKAKIESQERVVSAQQEELAKRELAKKQIEDKLASLIAVKRQHISVLERLDTEEMRYCSAFSLEAKGDHYSVYFRPAEHTEKTLRILGEQLRAAAVPYLEFRADVDPLLERIEAVRAERALAASREASKLGDGVVGSGGAPDAADGRRAGGQRGNNNNNNNGHAEIRDAGLVEDAGASPSASTKKAAAAAQVEDADDDIFF